MKILELRVKGFRSLADVTWKPGDLNVLIGPNAGGKSNLLKLFELISASAKGRLAKHVQREGGMGALVWDGKAESIDMSITHGVLTDQQRTYSGLEYHLSLARLGTTAQYAIEEESAVSSESREDLRTARDPDLPEETGLFTRGTILSFLGESTVADRKAAELYRAVRSWAAYQSFFTGRNATVRRAAVAAHQTQLQSGGQNLMSVLHTLYEGNRQFKREVNTAMRAAFGEEFEELKFPPAADQEVQLHIQWKSLERPQSAASLSDGTLRFLYLIAILANPNPPALIAIDEPETGLHPSMLAIIAEYAASAATRTQVVFTTHSPAFLDAFRQTPPTVTVVQQVEGKTKLQVRSGEELAYWLKEYSLGEMFRTGELETIG
jgi:predicted ATPase